MTLDEFDALHRCMTPHCTANATHRVHRAPASDFDAAMMRSGVNTYRSLLCDGHTARVVQLDTAARAERL